MHSTAAGLWETSTRNLKAQAIVEDAVWNDKDKYLGRFFTQAASLCVSMLKPRLSPKLRSLPYYADGRLLWETIKKRLGAPHFEV